MGTVDLGPLRRVNFKVSEGAAEVYGAVADFATPSLVWELFQRMPLKDMLQTIEANAVKVGLARTKRPLFPCPRCVLTVFLVQTMVMSRALDGDIAGS